MCVCVLRQSLHVNCFFYKIFNICPIEEESSASSLYVGSDVEEEEEEDDEAENDDADQNFKPQGNLIIC